MENREWVINWLKVASKLYYPKKGGTFSAGAEDAEDPVEQLLGGGFLDAAPGDVSSCPNNMFLGELGMDNLR